MLTVWPALFLAIPLLVIASLRRKWAVYVFLTSIPFYRVILFTTISHRFNLPELAVLILTAHYLREVVATKRLVLASKKTTTWLFGFVVVSILSVVVLLWQPPDVLVNPYQFGFAKVEVPVSVSRYNLTQLLLRIFFVVSVLVVAQSLKLVATARAIRLVVAGVAITALFGVFYQFSMLLGLEIVPRAFGRLGVVRLASDPRLVGPVPRMYSFPGEPGRTAAYFLLGLGYTLPFTLVDDQNGVFTRQEAILGSIFFLGAILLTTATTGIGGLAILLSTLVVVTVAASGLSTSRLSRYLTTSIVASGGVIIVLVFAGLNILDFVGYQVGKLTFSTDSGSKRMWYMLHAIDVFQRRPLLGVGVGSHHAPTLFSTVLVESGLFGLVTLVGATANVFLEAFRTEIHEHTGNQGIAAALVIGGVSVVLTQLLVHPPGALQQPWFWVSLALPLSYVTTR